MLSICYARHDPLNLLRIITLFVERTGIEPVSKSTYNKLSTSLECFRNIQIKEPSCSFALIYPMQGLPGPHYVADHIVVVYATRANSTSLVLLVKLTIFAVLPAVKAASNAVPTSFVIVLPIFYNHVLK